MTVIRTEFSDIWYLEVIQSAAIGPLGVFPVKILGMCSKHRTSFSCFQNNFHGKCSAIFKIVLDDLCLDVGYCAWVNPRSEIFDQ